MDEEVAKFEESILFFADAHRLHGPGSKFRNTPPTPTTPIQVSLSSSGITTPSRDSSPPLSLVSSNDSKHLSFGHRLLNLLNFSIRSGDIHIQGLAHCGGTFQEDEIMCRDSDSEKNNVLEAWQLEAANVDRAIRILPGVKRIIDSIPAGRYAVATSGAKAYGTFLLKKTYPPYSLNS